MITAYRSSLLHIENETLRRKFVLLGPKGICRLHNSREQKEACFKTTKDTILSTGYHMFLEKLKLFWQTTDWLHIFLKTNYIWRWQHEHLAPFQKHSKTIWDLSSHTWNSPIKSLYDFSLQMFLGHWRARNTPNKLQSPVISSESKISPGGQCSVKWSFKVTAGSQMSSKLHVKKMWPAKPGLIFVSRPTTPSREYTEAQNYPNW